MANGHKWSKNWSGPTAISKFWMLLQRTEMKWTIFQISFVFLPPNHFYFMTIKVTLTYSSTQRRSTHSALLLVLCSVKHIWRLARKMRGWWAKGLVTMTNSHLWHLCCTRNLSKKIGFLRNPKFPITSSHWGFSLLSTLIFWLWNEPSLSKTQKIPRSTSDQNKTPRNRHFNSSWKLTGQEWNMGLVALENPHSTFQRHAVRLPNSFCASSPGWLPSLPPHHKARLLTRKRQTINNRSLRVRPQWVHSIQTISC
jgi:hypothetical protein